VLVLLLKDHIHKAWLIWSIDKSWVFFYRVILSKINIFIKKN